VPGCSLGVPHKWERRKKKNRRVDERMERFCTPRNNVSENIAQMVSLGNIRSTWSHSAGLHPCGHRMTRVNSRSVKCLGAASDFHTYSHPFFFFFFE